MTRKGARLVLLACTIAGAYPAAQEHHPHHATVASAPPRSVVAGPRVMEDISSDPGTVEVVLTASHTRLSLLRGTSSEVYAYNGRVPGPTLEVREGDTVIVHFRNDLPEPTTVHWHGLHIPFDADGSPYHPVPPGGTHDYVFTLKPGSAGTYWYHPHPHDRTGLQVGKGLYGALVVRAPDDPLPAGLREQLLVLADNRFLPDGSIDFPPADSPQARVDFENGRQGDILFVNGEVMPAIAIRSGEVQRWRVINASAARVYKLSLAGHTLLHVGNDGGLFEHPLEVNDILVANSERVELLVRGTAEPGTATRLQTLPYDRFIPQTRPKDWNVPRDLLTLQYTNEPRLPSVALPELLRPIPPLDVSQARATRTMVLTQGFINGRTMDMTRADVSAELGATEIWEIENLVGMDHPFHLHGFQFQVLDRNGVPEPYRSWKDTVNVPKHETVRFIVRYDNHPGKWMFHCHILDHEDHGMMGVLEVR
jgi:FtsP/CotA-like multicopper oxidase with cupredoxin domain